MKVLACYGTRPEAIKLFPVVRELDCDTLFSGQHFSLIDDVAEFLPRPTYDLRLYRSGDLDRTIAAIIERVGEIVSSYDLVIVEGDTATVLAMALSAFNHHVKVAYVESGLRTRDMDNPFPEEGYRQMVSRIATYHFCPTGGARENLAAEGITKNVHVVGNTSIDALAAIVEPTGVYNDEVLITLHRRENAPHMRDLLAEIDGVAGRYSDLNFVFPAHPTGYVQEAARGLHNIRVCEPLKFREIARRLVDCRFVITDSGGIQEEITYLGKRALVCRNKTERPESVKAGFSVLCGTHPATWIDDFVGQYRIDPEPIYGDGQAATRIRMALEGYTL